MPVLVVTNDIDPTADRVIEELNRRGTPVLRCDTADFPMNLSFTAELSGAWAGTIRTTRRHIDLSDITGIYYRRPSEYRFPEGMAHQHRRWACMEAKIGFLGTLAALPRWLNHPARIAAAEYKPVQLSTATTCGLRVPHTLITNVSADAEEFAQQVGDVVYKPMSALPLADDGTVRHLLFARRVTAEDLADEAIGLTAHMVQEWVEHTHAVRLTAVDDRLFATEIHAATDETHVDWRTDYDALEYQPADVPERVAEGVRRLLRTLDLRFGALDFLVTPEGEWVFLEINPNGQWAWIAQAAPDNAHAIATALTEGPPDDR